MERYILTRKKNNAISAAYSRQGIRKDMPVRDMSAMQGNAISHTMRHALNYLIHDVFRNVAHCSFTVRMRNDLFI